MKFLIDTEKFLSKKKISFKHFMLMSVLSISLLWIVISGMLYEDYFPIITAVVTLVLCFSFHYVFCCYIPGFASLTLG